MDVDSRWLQVLEARTEILKRLEEVRSVGEDSLENPLDAGVVVPDKGGQLSPFTDALRSMCGVSRLRCEPDQEAIEIQDLRDQPSCERSWRRDETVSLRANGAWLSDRDWEAVQALTKPDQ